MALQGAGAISGKAAAQPGGGNALTIVCLFHGELAIVQVGHHGITLVALYQFTAPAALVLGVGGQVSVSRPRRCLPIGQAMSPAVIRPFRFAGKHFGLAR